MAADAYRQETAKYADKIRGIGQRRTETDKVLAEGVGFEPTIRFPVYTLSKRAPSATRPSLRERCGAGNITTRGAVTTRAARGDPPRQAGSASIERAHVARLAHVIAGELGGTVAERRCADEFEQRLQARPKIVALVQ